MTNKEYDTKYFAGFQVLSVILFQMRLGISARYSYDHSGIEKRPQWALKNSTF